MKNKFFINKYCRFKKDYKGFKKGDIRLIYDVEGSDINIGAYDDIWIHKRYLEPGSIVYIETFIPD
jgi:hypothetical protein